MTNAAHENCNVAVPEKFKINLFGLIMIESDIHWKIIMGVVPTARRSMEFYVYE